MIKVQFKNQYEDTYNNKEYDYADYKDAAVGDIVVVNTRCGYAIARVSQIDALQTYAGELQTVEKVITTESEIQEKKDAKAKRDATIRKFINDVRRKTNLGYISGFTDNKEYLEAIGQLNEEELNKLVQILKQ